MSPAEARPPGAGTFTIWIWPTFVPFAVTVPSRPIAIVEGSVPFGTVSGGDRRSPLAVTIAPWASRPSWPSRVRPMLPSARRTWMKPGPTIATESGSPVCVSEPSAKVRPRSIVAEPAPTGWPCSAK